MYNNIRPQIDFLLKNILEETRKDAQNKVANLERYKDKMQKWFSGNYASSEERQRYENIIHNISKIHDKLKLNSYFDYDDALQLASSANEEVNRIQVSIKSRIVYLQDNIKHNEYKLDEMSKNLSEKSHEYEKGKSKSALAAIMIPIIIYFVGSWFLNTFFSAQAMRSGLFILGIIIFLLVGLSILWFAGLFTLGSVIEYFQKSTEKKTYTKKVSEEEKRIKTEIATSKQILAIAKESIIK